MTDALIFISTHAVAPDALPELRELSARFVAGPVLAEALRVNAEAGARVVVVADRLAGFQRPVAA